MNQQIHKKIPKLDNKFNNRWKTLLHTAKENQRPGGGRAVLGPQAAAYLPPLTE